LKPVGNATKIEEFTRGNIANATPAFQHSAKDAAKLLDTKSRRQEKQIASEKKRQERREEAAKEKEFIPRCLKSPPVQPQAGKCAEPSLKGVTNGKAKTERERTQKLEPFDAAVSAKPGQAGAAESVGPGVFTACAKGNRAFARKDKG
jgi:HD-GYP domain-containing protein (c-di-GMP phosphodiesterase class II)